MDPKIVGSNPGIAGTLAVVVSDINDTGKRSVGLRLLYYVTCTKTNIFSGNKAFFDVNWSPLSNSVLTASADRHIRLYDPRSSGT